MSYHTTFLLFHVYANEGDVKVKFFKKWLTPLFNSLSNKSVLSQKEKKITDAKVKTIKLHISVCEFHGKKKENKDMRTSLSRKDVLLLANSVYKTFFIW